MRNCKFFERQIVDKRSWGLMFEPHTWGITKDAITTNSGSATYSGGTTYRSRFSQEHPDLKKIKKKKIIFNPYQEHPQSQNQAHPRIKKKKKKKKLSVLLSSPKKKKKPKKKF